MPHTPRIGVQEPYRIAPWTWRYSARLSKLTNHSFRALKNGHPLNGQRTRDATESSSCPGLCSSLIEVTMCLCPSSVVPAGHYRGACGTAGTQMEGPFLLRSHQGRYRPLHISRCTSAAWSLQITSHLRLRCQIRHLIHCREAGYF